MPTVRGVYKLDDGMFDVELLTMPRRNIRAFHVNGFQRIRVLRKVPCGVEVCQQHLQARGPGVCVCSSHWSAWENI